MARRKAQAAEAAKTRAQAAEAAVEEKKDEQASACCEAGMRAPCLSTPSCRPAGCQASRAPGGGRSTSGPRGLG